MGMDILIVEDHADIRRLLRLTLEMEDHQVREASRADQAVEQVAARRPDVVLLDVRIMGGSEGFQLCRRWRQDRSLDGMCVVMLTALNSSEDFDAGIEAGADAYMLKPFSPMRLIDAIDAAAKTRRAVA